ncbi:MAG: methylmalonyl Co-A mutase-associated GTPase MeaB, partial [Acidobacteriaceae bacterium]
MNHHVMTGTDLADKVMAGDRLALARTLSQVENNTPEGIAALNDLFPRTGKAHLVGVTGASGTGKSSLVNQLAHYYRQDAGQSASSQAETPRRVAVVAVDPTSPFTGGAILGDRIRMRDLAGDQGGFIRSMATRGSLGGLAAATGAVVQVLDAAGFALILIETVGAGQSEVDIARLAHTTIVVEAPGLGDDIQAIKAGILEIADVLVVNKADLPGVENTERALRGSLSLANSNRQPGQSIRRVVHHGQAMALTEPEPEVDTSPPVWVPPILRTNALDGTGVPELAQAIASHRAYLESTGGWG